MESIIAYPKQKPLLELSRGEFIFCRRLFSKHFSGVTPRSPAALGITAAAEKLAFAPRFSDNHLATAVRTLDALDFFDEIASIAALGKA